MRLCANTKTQLHLVHPLGFWLDEPRLRRAGMDYRHQVALVEHADWPSLQQWFATHAPLARLYALSTHATRCYAEVQYQAGDALLFGPETRGLPSTLLAALPAEQCLRIPMGADSRSLNLANAVAIVVYEAWRQQGFA
jgi:tRNA (cytidine/uridine-2'-O-)-methyltransferase